MPSAKIKKSAWLKVAKDSKNNGTKLNLSMVEDLIDRQSNAFARRTFPEEVEQQMRINGDVEEAEFCRLIRNWHVANRMMNQAYLRWIDVFIDWNDGTGY